MNSFLRQSQKEQARVAGQGAKPVENTLTTPPLLLYSLSNTRLFDKKTRSAVASLIDNTEANKTAIKRILGHANADITEHYTHKNIEDLIAAINLI